MIASRDAQAGVAIDDARGFRSDGNVREQSCHQTRTDCGAVHRRHNRLAAIDDVVNQVFRFAPDAGADVEIARHFFDQFQIAAAGKALTFAAQNRNFYFRIDIEGSPNFRELVMHAIVGS